MGDRRSIRLKNHDYSLAGYYFITICTQKHRRMFGDIINQNMTINDVGIMIKKLWEELPQLFDSITLDEFLVMPNHFHAIIQIIPKSETAKIKKTVGTPLVGAQKRNAVLGQIIGAYKSLSTNRYIYGVKNYSWLQFDGRLWQRNYFEHIIRNNKSLNKIRKYIIDNPANWDDDCDNPNQIDTQLGTHKGCPYTM